MSAIAHEHLTVSSQTDRVTDGAARLGVANSPGLLRRGRLERARRRTVPTSRQLEVPGVQSSKLLFGEIFDGQDLVRRPSDESEKFAELDLHRQRVLVLRPLNQEHLERTR